MIYFWENRRNARLHFPDAKKRGRSHAVRYWFLTVSGACSLWDLTLCDESYR